MKILLATGEEHSSCLINALKKGGHDIVGVLFPDNEHFHRTSYGKRQLWFQFRFGKLPFLCLTENIPYRVNCNLFDGSLLSWIRELEADLLLVLSWPQHIPGTFINLFNRGGMNIHPSLLPKLRGRDPIFSAVLKDQPGFGISFHKMEQTMDTGNIYLQKPLPRNPSDHYEKLYFRFMRTAASLAPLAIARLIENPGGTNQTGTSTRAEAFTLKHTLISSDDSWHCVINKSKACSYHHKIYALCGDTLICMKKCRLLWKTTHKASPELKVIFAGINSLILAQDSARLICSGVRIVDTAGATTLLPVFLKIKRGQTFESEYGTLKVLKNIQENHHEP